MEGQQQTVLIVEADKPLRNAISSELSKAGFRTLVAVDMDSGLSIASDTHPNLIVMDIVAPTLSDEFILENLRSSEWGKHVPLILLTNLNQDSKKVANILANYGPAFYLSKSDWKLSDVVEQCQRQLEQKL